MGLLGRGLLLLRATDLVDRDEGFVAGRDVRLTEGPLDVGNVGLLLGGDGLLTTTLIFQ